MTQRIYLDTNHWIKLLTIKQGRENDNQLKEFFVTLKELTQSNKICVLFSIFTLLEIYRYHNKIKQNELIDLMLDVSKSRVLKPYNIFHKKEIEDATAYVAQHQHIHDIRSEILGRGLDVFGLSFEDFFARNPILSSQINVGDYESLKKYYHTLSENSEVVKQVLKDPSATIMAQKSLEDCKSIINDMNKHRAQNSAMSNDLFFRYSKARYLISLELPLVRFMMSKGITVQQIFSSKEKTELFSKHLNSLNVNFVLTLERDVGTKKQFSHNDFFDIAHLSGSIPYCDVVVTDGMFAHLCKRKKLNKTYDCCIFSDLKSLSAYLELQNLI